MRDDIRWIECIDDIRWIECIDVQKMLHDRRWKWGGGNIKADIRDSVLLGKNQGLPGKMKAILPPKYIKKMDLILKKYI